MLSLEQKSAVEFLGPLLLIAGPGSGKTRVIIEKINYILNKNNKENNKKILAITFTNKAAEELKIRLEKKLSKLEIEKKIISSTFHSFSSDLIEEFSSILNLPKNYKIIEESHQLIFFLDLFEKYNPKVLSSKDKVRLSKEVLSFFSKINEFGYSLNDFQRINFQDFQLKSELLSIYASYQKWKLKKGFLDFGDIQLKLLELLENQKIREEIKNRYEHILVDECQDNNPIQIKILSKINLKNITFVGDEKQSIYSFRGSFKDVKSELEKYFPGIETKYLTKNFRSNKTIVSIINKLINSFNLKDQIMSSDMDEESKIFFTRCNDEKSQLSYIIERIQDLKNDDRIESIGILCRRNQEVKEISNFLEKFSIPHASINQNSFISNYFIEEAIKTFNFILDPLKNDIILFDLLKHQTNISKQSLLYITRKTKLNERPLFKILEGIEDLGILPEEKKSLENLYSNYKKLLEMKSYKISFKDFFIEILNKTSILSRALLSDIHSKDNFENKNLNSINNFLEFVDNLEKTFKNRDLDFLKRLLDLSKRINPQINNLDFENNLKKINQNKAIEVLTIHQSKGKEFDAVILPFLNERRFPGPFKKFSFEDPFEISREDFFQEELRLFFVAVSRAKKIIDFSYINKYSSNKLESKPSRFLEFLDLDFPKEYARNSEEIFLSEKKVEKEILDKLVNEIHSKDFDSAKKTLKILEELFSKKSGLKNFIKSDDPELNKYELDIKEQKNGSQMGYDFDFSTMVYSVSQIKTYQSCPKKYEFSYIFKIPTLEKPFFDFGNSLHKTLEDLKPLIDSGLSKEKSILRGMSLLSKNWISKGYNSYKEEREYFEKGISSLKNFVEKEFSIKEDKKRRTIELEKKFNIKIKNKNLVGFIDRIDIVNDDYQILDYKTSNSMERVEDLKNNLQLYVYAKALKEVYGKFPKEMGLWYLIHNKIDLIKFDKEKLEEIEKEINKTIEEIESFNFKAKPSHFACSFCDFSQICKDSLKK